MSHIGRVRREFYIPVNPVGEFTRIASRGRISLEYIEDSLNALRNDKPYHQLVELPKERQIVLILESGKQLVL